MEYLGIQKLTDKDNIECNIIEGASYCLINRIVRRETHKEYAGKRVFVRVDIMTADHNPVISYESDNMEVLRKHVVVSMNANHNERGLFTHEHAAYIGSEIMRAYMDERFKQD